jgi:glyoxylase-like metal-dependent hydrolase (beta-lactamase superfamily II)
MHIVRKARFLIPGAMHLLAALPVVLVLCGTANAAAPLARTQAPGFYRMILGDFEVTALSDGTFEMHTKQFLTNTTPEKIDAALARAFLTDPVEASVNAFLINTGTRLVLIDAGAGVLFGPTLGRVAANLRASGYTPEQVDAIYITHLHGDHVGGVMDGEKRLYPNATVFCDKHEADHWLSEAQMNAAPDVRKDTFKGAMASIKPYVASGRFQTFEGDTELAPGIRAVAAHGHTPGHTVYIVESADQRLVLWGDLMHVGAVQFPEPTVTIRFDSDSPAAATQRAKVFADVASRGSWVAGPHLPFPGIGHLRAEGLGYSWVPANYTALR